MFEVVAASYAKLTKGSHLVHYQNVWELVAITRSGHISRNIELVNAWASDFLSL